MKTHRLIIAATVALGLIAGGCGEANKCLGCWWRLDGKCVKPDYGYCLITRSK